jgi:Na+/H+ antiporter NhaD/arsenite permease-like protein
LKPNLPLSNPYVILALIIFVLGYALITMEHFVSAHKSSVAMVLAVLLWLTAAQSGISGAILEHGIHTAGSDIFEIVVFLLAAMSLVEVLVHYKFFDIIRNKLAKYNLKDNAQFIILAYITFFLSAVLDNLTVTIVMVQIARRFFKDKNLLVVVCGIIVMANAGGSWSPIGDVTTIMIWLAAKFSSWQIITQGFLPALILGSVTTFLLNRKIKHGGSEVHENGQVHLTSSEKYVIAAAFGSFALPVIMHSLGLRPYMGLLLGLGIVWAMVEFYKVRSDVPTHLEANIEKILQKTDISSLNFFIGILLSVSALEAMGILDILSKIAFGAEQAFTRVAIGNVATGLLSAIVDNVPLTALSINVIKIADPHIWILLALTVGTGGSVLIIGSVAGVVAMGMVKELNFQEYIKIASVPVLVGYFIGVATWYLQYLIIR